MSNKLLGLDDVARRQASLQQTSALWSQSPWLQTLCIVGIKSMKVVVDESEVFFIKVWNLM